MARSDPRKLRTPKLSGAIIVDSYRGQARVRSWPKKTGRPKSPAVRQQNAWVKASTQIWKAIPASQQKAAREQTAGTGLYPRDIFTMAMSGGLFDLLDEDGTLIRFRRQFVRRVMFQGCIIRKTSTQNVPANVHTDVTWPLPDLDTAGFYDPLTPTKLIVPPSVAVCQFFYGVLCSGAGTGDKISCELRQNGTGIGVTFIPIAGGGGVQVFSGPVVVNEGDEFTFTVDPIGFAGTVQPGFTFVAAQILGTDF